MDFGRRASTGGAARFEKAKQGQKEMEKHANTN
jgi:hypothetical protein